VILPGPIPTPTEPRLLKPVSEIREHTVCPACDSERTAPVGDILAVGRLIKVTHRCASCGTLFVLFRRAV
jgi:hypothetical protein